jgi:dihydroneopterin aldolase
MRITIEKYPVYVKIGHFARERLVGQELLVSLAVDLLPQDFASMADELEATLDYSQLFAAIDRELAHHEIKLLESAVLRLGQQLLQSFEVIAAVEVRIEKPVLPHGLNKGARVSIAHSFCRH